MNFCSFRLRSLRLFFNTVSSYTLPYPIHVFFFARQVFKPNLYNSFYTCFSNKDQGFNLSKYKFRNQICTELMCDYFILSFPY